MCIKHRHLLYKYTTFKLLIMSRLSKLVSHRVVKNSWIKMLSKHNYNYIATIQKPMKNPYKFESNLRRLSECEQIERMFYSVERNSVSGYHIHLMLKAHRTHKRDVAYVTNLSQSDIPYFEKIEHNYKVASYVTKYMKGDQLHYNFY